MISRRISLGLFVSGAVLSRAAAHPAGARPPNQSEIEQQILAFRAALKAAIVARDAARLKTMYAESFTHTHGSGKIDGRDARLVSLLTGEPTIEMAPASELSFRIHGPDTVVLTGKSPILNVKEQRDYDFRWVQVYSRASGEWQLVVSQATRLPTTS